jgi:hypothetical protein
LGEVPFGLVLDAKVVASGDALVALLALHAGGFNRMLELPQGLRFLLGEPSYQLASLTVVGKDGTPFQGAFMFALCCALGKACLAGVGISLGWHLSS